MSVTRSIIQYPASRVKKPYTVPVLGAEGSLPEGLGGTIELRVRKELDFNAASVTAPTTGVEGAINFTVYDGPPQIRYSVGDIVVYNDIYYQVVQTLFNSTGVPPDLTPSWYTVIESLGAEWITFGMKGAWSFLPDEEDTIVTAINFPKDMDLAEAPSIKLNWSSHAISDDVVWQLEYLYRGFDEDTTAEAQGTLTQIATSSSTADGFKEVEFMGLDIPNVNDRTIFIRVKRLGNDVDDTIEDTAELHSIIFRYITDKLGEAI